jgi:hypothetical protein
MVTFYREVRFLPFAPNYERNYIMAYGSELYLGWVGKTTIDDVCAKLGITFDWDNRDFVANNRYMQLSTEIQEAYLAAMQDLFKYNKVSDTATISTQQHLIKFGSYPFEFSPWNLEVSYDPYELGDIEDTAVMGLSLIGRYYPTFLDWDHEHGGSSHVIALDTKTTYAIYIATDYLIPVHNVFRNMTVIVKMKHY